mmetsp:Transcript_27608/g.36221  ORF Transcript_27608/g.36221 Transcript_27608/m.36221 type:complete len:578 (+) Transcript_27608:99-1832(+)
MKAMNNCKGTVRFIVFFCLFVPTCSFINSIWSQSSSKLSFRSFQTCLNSARLDMPSSLGGDAFSPFPNFNDWPSKSGRKDSKQPSLTDKLGESLQTQLVQFSRTIDHRLEEKDSDEEQKKVGKTLTLKPGLSSNYLESVSLVYSASEKDNLKMQPIDVKATKVIVSPKAEPYQVVGAGIFGSALTFSATAGLLLGSGMETAASVTGGLAGMALALNDEGSAALLAKTAGAATYDTLKTGKEFAEKCIKSEPVKQFTKWLGNNGVEVVSGGVSKTFEALNAKTWEREARFQTEKAQSYLRMLTQTQEDLKERNTALVIAQNQLSESNKKLEDLGAKYSHAKAKQTQMQVRDERIRQKIGKLQYKIEAKELAAQALASESIEKVKLMETKLKIADQKSQALANQLSKAQSELDELPKVQEKVASLNRELFNAQQKLATDTQRVNIINSAKDTEAPGISQLYENEKQRSAELEMQLRQSNLELSKASATLSQVKMVQQLESSSTSSSSIAILDFWSGMLLLASYTVSNPFIKMSILRKLDFLVAVRCCYSMVAYGNKRNVESTELEEEPTMVQPQVPVIA